MIAAALAWTGGLLLARAHRPDAEVITLRPDQLPSFHPHPSGGATITLGSVGPGRAAGCVTAPPANQFTCVNGVWIIPGNQTGSSAAPPATNPAGAPPPTAPCVGTPPITGTGQTVACENGVWVIR